MTNTDNRTYVKQGFAGFLNVMMVLVTSYAESKFLFLSMNAIKALGRCLAVTFICSSTLVGCAGGSRLINEDGLKGAHLYNAEDHKASSAAKAAVVKLDLPAIIKKERNNRGKLLERELSVVAEFAVVRRDTALRALLEPRLNVGETEALSDKTARKILDRLAELFGGAPDDAKKAATKYRKLARDRDRKIDDFYKPVAQDFKTALKIDPPSCNLSSIEPMSVTDENRKSDLESAKAKAPDLTESDFNKLLDEFVKTCDDVAAMNKIISVATENFDTIKTVNSEFVRESSAITAQKMKLEVNEHDDVVTEKENYLKALEAVKKAEKQLAAGKSSELEQVLQDKVGELRKGLNKLTEAAGSFGQKEAAEIQVKNIDALLGEIAAPAGSTSTSDLQGARAIVAQLPSFAAHAAAIARSGSQPSLNALLLEKARLLALKTNAEQRIARGKLRLQLLEQKKRAIEIEVDTLLRADQHLGWAVAENGGATIRFEDLKNPKKMTENRHLVNGIGVYLSSFTGPRRAVHAIDYRLIDLKHQAALDNSATALSLWQVSIVQPVNSLDAFFESGIKPEQIIELLKAFGLTGIAVGVN